MKTILNHRIQFIFICLIFLAGFSSCKKYERLEPMQDAAYVRVITGFSDPLGTPIFTRVFVDYSSDTPEPYSSELQYAWLPAGTDLSNGQYASINFQSGPNEYNFPGPVNKGIDYYKWRQLKAGQHEFLFSNVDDFNNGINTVVKASYDFKAGEFYSLYIVYDDPMDPASAKVFVQHEDFTSYDFSDRKLLWVRFQNLMKTPVEYDIYFQTITDSLDEWGFGVAVFAGQEQFFDNMHSSRNAEAAGNVHFRSLVLADSLLNDSVNLEPADARLCFKFYEKGKSAQTGDLPVFTIVSKGYAPDGIPYTFFDGMLAFKGPGQIGSEGTVLSISFTGGEFPYPAMTTFALEPVDARDKHFR